jgi:Tol biopolymer transport system component
VRGSIWVIDSDGSGLREINVQGLTCRSSGLDQAGFGCHEPRWSPDGTKIVFAGNSQLTGVNIYTINVDGSGLHQLTTDGGSDDPFGALTRSRRDERRLRGRSKGAQIGQCVFKGGGRVRQGAGAGSD